MGQIARLCALCVVCVTVAVGLCGSPVAQTSQERTSDPNVRRDANGNIQLPPTSGPGTAIQAAAEASAQDRRKFGPVDILSDTQGVDFGHYLQNVVASVRENWYRLIPQSVETKKGKLAIEFAISKNGAVAGMKLVTSSGDVNLDRPAWGGITASTPFPPLPAEFKGPYLALRFRFFYNPDKTDLAEDTPSPPLAENRPSPPAHDPVAHAVLIKEVADSNSPKYPKKAISAKVDGIVRLEAVVKTDGKLADVRVLEGDATLAEASVHAIRNWRFQPARMNGRPIEDRVRIKVEFRLNPELVRAKVVWPEPTPAVTPPQ